MEHERPLEDYTVKELRTMALEMGGIVGVSAMKKEELLSAIKKARGIPEKEIREKPIPSILELKKEIRSLKQAREDLRRQGEDRQKLWRLRKRIGRLKKMTRRLAARK
ncbi:MAG: Rho termination factor N-terminal domain-containing protein [Syntrophales bacterium]